MELLSVRTARVLAFFLTDQINPRGRSLIHDVVPAFVERYKFTKHPQTLEEFDETKGVRFEAGVWNGLELSIILYNNGIMVDTRSSTDDSERLLEDALKWATDTFELIYKPDMITRKAYLSELDIKCDTPLDALNPKLEAFANKWSKMLGQWTGHTFDFKTASFWLNFDTAFNKGPSGPFRIERLIDTPFSENKYYAGAPLPTKLHLEFLEEFEAILKG